MDIVHNETAEDESAQPVATPITPPYKGVHLVDEHKDGTRTVFLPLVDVARSLGADYRTLRNYVRDHKPVSSEKMLFPDPERPGNMISPIVTRRRPTERNRRSPFLGCWAFPRLRTHDPAACPTTNPLLSTADR